MFRIGIVGSDNSHAEAFSKLLNNGLDRNDELARLLGADSGTGTLFPYPNYKVTAIFGTDPERTKQVAEIGNIPYIAPTPEDMLGKVDGVMVVWRHGGLHNQYAMPFVKAGIPVWIDKPFTIDPAEAEAIFDAAEKSGTILAGGSTVKYLPKMLELKAKVAEAGKDFKGGSMTYAVSLKNDYGNIFFYASHIVECALEVFGYDVRGVFAAQNDNGVTAVLRYDDYACALQFVVDNYRYRVQLNIGKDTEYFDFDIPGTYSYGFGEYAKAIEAGHTLVDRDKMLRAIRLLDAIARSAASGTEIKL